MNEKKKKSENFFDKENNNFNLVRMLGAFMVIYAHSFSIQPNGNVDIVSRISKVTHAGQLAVFIFVFLAGIYLCKSLKNSKNFFQFIFKKIMRIFPLLIVTLIFIIGIGAIFTNLPLSEYFSNSMTRNYFIHNILNISNEHYLPGVFLNHADQSMNGVLWYITYILRVYLIGGLLYFSGIFNDKQKANINLLILLIWISIFPNSFPLLGSNYGLYGSPVFPQYTITLLIACLVYVNFPNKKVNPIYIVIILLFGLVQKDFTYENTLIIWALLSILTGLFIGTFKPLLKLKIPDYSFTIFLFGWPIQQIICEFLPKISPLMNTFLSIFVVILISFLINISFDKWIKKLTKYLNKILFERGMINEKE